MNASEFLRSKSMLDPDCTQFVIEGRFGEIELIALLSEFAESQTKDDKWINVDDRLPETEGIYLCVIGNYNPFVAEYSHSKGWFDKDEPKDYFDPWSKDVTRWRTLPES